MRNIAAFLGALLLLFSTAQAASYLDNSPLAAEVRQGVRDCRGGSDITMPLITWGADEVTIHANGGKRTRSGSIFAGKGLKVTLKREDVFANQVRDYMSCKSPFLRATLGMAAMAADVTEQDRRTKMVAVYQHSYSAGGDAMVVRGGIRQPSDLRGKTIVLQRYGPHVDYLMKVLTDAGLTPDDVTIKWVKDLTGSANSPAEAMRSDGSIDAAMVIIPDALVLTSDGNIGTGSEGSIRGARILLSTKSANRIITDMYFVRKDFYDANKQVVAKIVQGLLESEEQVRAKARNKGRDWKELMKLSAEILLDDKGATADAEALWMDAETTGRRGNLRFFTDFNYLRGFSPMSTEVQNFLRGIGQLSAKYRLSRADWDWEAITGTRGGGAPEQRFDTAVTQRVVAGMHEQGTIEEGTLISFEIFFKPNQKEFSPEMYTGQFNKVIALAATYGGAVITVDGHADPSGYVRQIKKGQLNGIAAKRKVQAARNLSVSRAQSVRDAILSFAEDKGQIMDPSQFVTTGLGYSKPKTGMCNIDTPSGMQNLPCYPKNKQQWLSNMRVEFRLVNVEAEANAFVPMD